MPNEAPPPPEPIRKEISPAREAVDWVRSHAVELTGDPDFAYHAPVSAFIKAAVNDDLSIATSARTVFDNGVMEHYISLVQHNPTVKTALLRTTLAHVDAGMTHAADSQQGWMNTLRREGNHMRPDNLTTRAGVYMFGIAPDMTGRSVGTVLQRTVAQLSLELARTEATHATKRIPYVRDPPPITEARKNIAAGAESYGLRAAKGDLDWQKANPALSDITTAYAPEGSQTRDPLIRVISGKVEYRPTPADTGRMTVRLIRKDGFMDVTVNTFLSLTGDGDGIGNVLSGTTDAVPGLEGTWKRFSELPDAKTDPVVFSVSAGGYPSPESAIAELGRSGRAVTHVHFNTRHPSGAMVELYQSHVSADGAPAKAIAFGVARAIDAYTPTAPVERVSWYPPTKTAPLPSTEELVELNNALVESGNPMSENDSAVMRKLIDSMGMSDVLVAGSVPKDATRAIYDFGESLNDRVMKPLRMKLLDMLIRDDVSAEAQKIILNRIVTTRITPNKAMDILARLYFGPTAVCGQTRDAAMGVHLTLSPVVHKELRDELIGRITSGSLDPETLFTVPSPAVAAELAAKGKTAADYPGWIAERLGDATKLVAAEYAFLYFGASPPMAISEATDGWRQFAEGGTAFLTPDLREEVMVRAQHSALGENVASVGGKTVYIVEFESALSHENRLAVALATLDSPTDTYTPDITSLIRIQMTPELFQSLDITSSRFREEYLARIPGRVAPGDATAQEEVARETARALAVWDQEYRKISKGTLAERALRLLDRTGITTRREAPASPAFVAARVLAADPGALRGLQYLLLGGVRQFSDRFYDASGAAAKRFNAIL